MVGIRSVRCDRVTDDMIVAYVRRWSPNNRITTKMIANHFGLRSHGLLGRLKRMQTLSYETVAVLGNIWKVKA